MLLAWRWQLLAASLAALGLMLGCVTQSPFLTAAWLPGDAGRDVVAGTSDPSGPPRPIPTAAPQPAVNSTQVNTTAIRNSPTPRVVAFGHVDVEGGTIPLAPALAGIVEDVAVKEGEHVAAGQVILKLRPDQAGFELSRAEVAVREANTKLVQALRAPSVHSLLLRQQEQSVAAAEARLEGHRRQIDRLERLNESSAVPNENLQLARDRGRELEAALTAEQLKLDNLKLDNPNETVELARALLAAAEIQRARAKDLLTLHCLTAPEAGVVLRLNVSRGQVLGPVGGAMPGPPPLWFCPDKKRVVRCEVDQEFASAVAPGMPTELISEGLEPRIWRGTVDRCSEWIAPKRSLLDEPLQRNDVRTLEVIISLNISNSSSGPPPRIGQRIRAIIYSDASAELAWKQATVR